MQSTSKLILPEPTYMPPDPSKKSHARRQPLGHVPRPRNAFILFRCDFVRQKKIPQSVEKDHRNISRIVGRIWRGMTAQEREPWVRMAGEEKANHIRIHPGYRFTRGGPNGRRRTKRGDEAYPVQEEDLTSLCPTDALLDVNLEFSNGYGNPMKSRDDLERRPSRVTLHQSAPNDFAEAVKERQDSIKKECENAADETPKDEVFGKDADGIFCGPHFDAMQYPVITLGKPLESWEYDTSDLWGSSTLLCAAINDTNEYLSQNPSSTFTYPLSALPPLPRFSPAYVSEEDHRTSFLAARKTSSFFSPRSGTWKLPLPVPNPSAIPSNLDLSFVDSLPSDSRKSFDLTQEGLVADKNARGIGEEAVQELARQWFGDMITGERVL